MNSPEQCEQIVCMEASGDGTQFILNKVKLRKIFHEAGEKPTILLPILGQSGGGRSFVMNYLLKHLLAKQDNNDDGLRSDRPYDALQGFGWSHQEGRHTEGIWITRYPILLKSSNGNEFAVYLMDTQGVFDEYSSETESSFILDLCLHFSTILIFNTTYELSEDKLQLLADAMETSKAKEDVSCQNLYILVRDWVTRQGFQVDQDGGEKYLNSRIKIKPHYSNKAKALRQTLASNTKQLSCFLLPLPRDNVREIGYDGHLVGLSTKFQTSLEIFLRDLCSGDAFFSTKRQGSSYIREFEKFVTNYNDKILTGQPVGFKTTVQPYDSRVVFTAEKLKIICLTTIEDFSVKFNEYIQNFGNEYVPPALLSNEYQSIKCEYLQEFENADLPARYSTFKESLEFLNSELDKIYNSLSTINERKMNTVLTKWNEAYRKSTIYYQDLIQHIYKGRVTLNSAKMDNELIIKQAIQYFSDLLKPIFDNELLLEYQKKLSSKFECIFDEQTDLFERKTNNKMQLEFLAMKSDARDMYLLELKKLTHETVGWSHEGLSEFHKVVCRKVKSQVVLPAHDENNSHEEELLNTLNDTFRDVSKINEVHREQFAISMKSKITSAVEEYERSITEFLSSSQKLTLDVIHQSHSTFTDKAFSFCNNEESPDIALKATFLDELKIKIEEIYNRHLQSYKQEQNNAEERTKSILISGVNKYNEKMQARMRTKELARNTDVDIFHKETVEEIFQECRLSDHNLFDEKAEQQLREDMERSVKDYKRKAETALKAREHEANFFLKQSVESFRSWLNEHRNQPKKIESEQESKTAGLITKFQDSCGIRDETFTVPYVEQLRSGMIQVFNQEMPAIRLKFEQDAILIKQKSIDICKFYENDMEKHFKSTKGFMKPADFRLRHEKVTNQLLERVAKNLSTEARSELRECLTPLYDKYNARNTMNTPGQAAIGIDLGTTHSCVAVYHNGKVLIIPQSSGNTIASYVAFTPVGELVGDPAKNQAHENATNTIFDAKRLIGRTMNDEHVKEDMKLWPFKVVGEEGTNKPLIMVQDVGREPEFISAKLLKHIKGLAEVYLQVPAINKAVITVPAYFNDGQRQATIDAAEVAGLEVLDIVNEPTAAAMAYYMSETNFGNTSSNILVYDLGGGTFDVSILNINGGDIKVLAVGGDTHLGGEDFDQKLVEHCISKFKIDTKFDLSRPVGAVSIKESVQVPRTLRRIRNECEKRKKDLSDAHTATIVVDEVIPGYNLNVPVSRVQLEDMNKVAFDKTIEIVDKTLKDARRRKEEINEIILIGGSSKIPKIRQLLIDFFGRQLCLSLNPDEAVAYGAAVLAAKLSGQHEQALKKISLKDVSPLSLGIKVANGTNNIIIPRNTPIPVKRVKTDYTTARDFQTEVTICIYEGEEKEAVKNHLLGEFTLSNIPSKRRGVENIHITMDISSQGILHVTAACASTGEKNDLVIQESKGRLTRGDIDRLRLALG